MTNLFSAISGQFSKALILGVFLPVVLFILLSLLFVVPLIPADAGLFGPLESLDTEWKVIAVFFLSFVLTGLLFNFNVPLIRFYEGYPWIESWVGKAKADHHKRQYRAMEARWRGMRTLLRALPAAADGYKDALAQLSKMGRRLNVEYPRGEALVLPTRLGNILRSFEDYPRQQYNISSITLWPRLIAVIAKDYAESIDSVKTSFDFALNCSALSMLLALTILLVGLLYPTAFASPEPWQATFFWLAKILIFAALSYWFYTLLLGRAQARGALIRGAYDLYRWDLLKQLGYKRMPTSMAEERYLWGEISQQLIYGDTPSTPLAEYQPQPTYALPDYKPAGADLVYLETIRGITRVGTDGGIKVTLKVKNVDVRQRMAKEVIVTDALSEGYEYKWDSVRSVATSGRPVEITGTNPCRFRVGNIAYDNIVVLEYEVIPRKKSD